MIDREIALEWLKDKVTNDNLIKHMLATEAIMRSLADKLGQDADQWGLTGLLHDLDFEDTKDNPAQHSLETVRFLQEQGVNDQKVLTAIQSHNYEMTKVARNTDLDYALTSAEQITGLIVGCALVRPDKKLSSLSKESVLKKFNQPAFTARVDRNLIKLSEKLGFSLDEFVDISLEAMQSISGELGL